MDSGGLLVIFLLMAAFLLYFLPAIIASNRNHKNGPAIFVLNLFLGWTFLGWVIALVWSFTDNVAKDVAPAAVYDETGDLGQETLGKDQIEAERQEPTFRT